MAWRNVSVVALPSVSDPAIIEPFKVMLVNIETLQGLKRNASTFFGGLPIGGVFGGCVVGVGMSLPLPDWNVMLSEAEHVKVVPGVGTIMLSVTVPLSVELERSRNRTAHH